MSGYESGIGSEASEFELEQEYGELESSELEAFSELEAEQEGHELHEALHEHHEAHEAHEQTLEAILGAPTPPSARLAEAHEVELATELLEVTNEEELEQFLGNVFKRVVRGVGTFVRSPVGRALGGVLKSVAKKALPVVGGALGSMVAPGLGTAIGSKLGSLASSMFELEGETLAGEQGEFEVARRYVRLAADAARTVAAAHPPPQYNPRTVARAALARAARSHAPGLYRTVVRSLGVGAGGAAPRVCTCGASLGVRAAIPVGMPSQAPGGNGAIAPALASGRWIRRGRKIVVLGV